MPLLAIALPLKSAVTVAQPRDVCKAAEAVKSNLRIDCPNRRFGMKVEKIAKSVSHGLMLCGLIVAAIPVVLSSGDRHWIAAWIQAAVILTSVFMYILWLYLLAEGVELLREIKEEVQRSTIQRNERPEEQMQDEAFE